MVKGAVKTSEYLFHGSEYAKQHIVPDSASKGVDPKVQAGLETAKWVSTGACRVSGWLVSKVREVHNCTNNLWVHFMYNIMFFSLNHPWKVVTFI